MSIEGTSNDSKKLDNLFNFAADLLKARSKTQLRVDQHKSKLGCFLELELRDLPGISYNDISVETDDQQWLSVKRLYKSQPPLPPEEYWVWIDKTSIKNPTKRPLFNKAYSKEILLSDAQKLVAEGKLRPNEIEYLQIEGNEPEPEAEPELEQKDTVDEPPLEMEEVFEDPAVRVTLFLKDDLDVETFLMKWRDQSWKPWADKEIPVHRSIGLYQKLFKLHSITHSGDSSANEIVWGVGMSTYGSSSTRVNMPLIELLVDLNLDDDGKIFISPRTVPPVLNLRPLLQARIEGSEIGQTVVQRAFDSLVGQSEFESNPFAWEQWEVVLELAATQLTANALYVAREEVEKNFEPAYDSDAIDPKQLVVSSTWTIYGRPRSTNFQVQDLKTIGNELGKKDEVSLLPECLSGFVAPLPEESGENPWGLEEFEIREPKDWESTGTYSSIQSSKVYYFPLPYNKEQAQIIDVLERHPVVTVTGPPGTGKTHSIANIIAHYMAVGKRVLVTARTAEAICAVQSKLPEELGSLVIASVASDREGTAQLEKAIQKLSDEVVSLQPQLTEQNITKLQSRIDQTDNAIRDCDKALDNIARSNLLPQLWQGEQVSVLDLSKKLEEKGYEYDWFQDRPTAHPPEHLENNIKSLKHLIPLCEENLRYLNQDFPAHGDLPTTEQLIDRHKILRSASSLELEDLSDQPTMARDTPNCLEEAEKCRGILQSIQAKYSEYKEKYFLKLLNYRVTQKFQPNNSLAQDEFQSSVAEMREIVGHKSVSEVYIDDRSVKKVDLRDAVYDQIREERFASLKLTFTNKNLNSVLESTTVDGRKAESPSDWMQVLEWLKLRDKCTQLERIRQPLEDIQIVPSGPSTPSDWLKEINYLEEDLNESDKFIDLVQQCLVPLERLFPYGLDVRASLSKMDFAALLIALRANLETNDLSDTLEFDLIELAVKGEHPVYQKIQYLADLLPMTSDQGQEIVTTRSALTNELSQLSEIKSALGQVKQHIDEIAIAGAPKWSLSMQQIITDGNSEVVMVQLGDWESAWTWAVAQSNIESIISLGNGDSVREQNRNLVKQKEKYFLEIIREKTLLGLNKRITPSVQSSLAEFTQAIKNLGAGTGKKAQRWRRVIRESAKKAGAAAPVWIMPESKVVEQIPTELGMFDLVILDEASQSDITSLGVLARGKKFLIVGDEKQVSPSAVGFQVDAIDSLRARHLSELPNKDSYDEKTSIFDIAQQRFPQSHLMLKEHFRCVHPIIQFSTRFYNDRLEPLRVPKASERFDPPLVDVEISDAVRIGKTNDAEAQFIVREIVDITQNPLHRSRDIAVISLIGPEQAEHIERLLMEHPKIGPEIISRHNIVCGDSRSMQGQERSVVFLSMLVTNDTARTQKTREDEQRFNVAMSRACDRQYLVRSVQSKALKTDDLKLAVIQHYADPLPEGQQLTGKAELDKCESGFERDVCRKLLDAGYRVRAQVSAGRFRIDLVVEGSDDRRLAVELDGDHWHKPEQWRDDMLRQATLERSGWTFWRVFGSQWYSATDHYWASLVSTLDELKIQPIGGEAVNEAFTEFRSISANSLFGEDELPLGVDQIVDTEFSDLNDDAGGGDATETEQESKEVSDGEQSSLDVEKNTIKDVNNTQNIRYEEQYAESLSVERFYEDDYRPIIEAISLDIIDREGPVCFDTVSVRVARLHGFKRTGKGIKGIVEQAIAGKRTMSHPESGGVYWPANEEPKEKIDFRGLEVAGYLRNWGDIPIPERIGIASIALSKGATDPISFLKSELDIKRAGAALQREFAEALQLAQPAVSKEEQKPITSIVVPLFKDENDKS